MERREFVAALLAITLAPSRVALAQMSSTTVRRVGYLYAGSLKNPTDREALDLFRSELARLGFPEGKNLVIETKFANGRPDTLGALAKELVDTHPDVIVAIATPAVAAAQQATSTIPIIMMPATDPIGSGFVKSLAHPGGNISGMANMYGDSVGKSIEILHSLVPTAKRIAVLMSSNRAHRQLFEIANDAIKSLGLAAIAVTAPNQDDLERAFDKMLAENCDALYVLADPMRPPIVSLAAKAKLPALYQYGGFVDVGGLASYGAEFNAILRKGADYVARILKGANPAETPVEQPVAFEFAINLKTAKELGLTIPGELLAR
ncbi:MAG: ABC transporter substrate-binding protein, partial [Bradyrhizobium sp.]